MAFIELLLLIMWTVWTSKAVNLSALHIIYQEGHEEAQEELPKKAKFFFSTAAQSWDAEFYVKVDDNINLDLGMASISYPFIKHHNFILLIIPQDAFQFSVI